jgi:heme exporter protein A
MTLLGRNHVLDVHHLQASRDDRVLFTGLGFGLSPGQVMQVAGPNGAGKTTLLNGIAGLFPFDSGDLRWQGRRVAETPTGFVATLHGWDIMPDSN